MRFITPGSVVFLWFVFAGCGGESATNHGTDSSTQTASGSDLETGSGVIDSASTDSETTATATQDTGTEDTATGSGSESQSDTEPVPDSADYEIGSFTVHWSASPEPGLIEVTHADEPGRVLFETVPGASFVQAKLVRTEWTENHGSFNWDETKLASCAEVKVALIANSASGLVLSGRFDDCEMGFSVRFFEQSAHQLGFAVEVVPDEPPAQAAAVWRAMFVYGSSADERFFGFGTQYTYLSPKGRRLPILSQEQGHGRGLQPLTGVLNSLGGGAGGSWFSTYAPAPQYITSTKRAVLLENYEFCYFDLRQDEEVQIELNGPSISGRILHGATMLDLIEEYTAYSGRMSPLPDWVNDGAIVGLMGGSEVVRQKLEGLLARHTPISGLWLQDWVGKRDTLLGTRLWWNWEIDRDTYPDWEELSAQMAQQGIRMLGYVNPFLSDPTSKPGGFEHNYFKEAKDAGYLVVGKTGAVQMVDQGGFEGALVDLSYEPARTWLKQVIIDSLIGSGMSGWMGDFGEALRFDAVPRSGESPATFHNRYPEEWARVNREAVSEAGLDDEIAFFLRCGYTKSPQYASLFWLGDHLVSWDSYDGIKTAVTGLLSSGFAGYSLNHSDIGGLIAFDYVVVKYVRSMELLVRWMEMNAFSAAFRNHEGNNPADGHQIYDDDETMDLFAKFSEVYAALGDYRRGLMQDASEKGYPVVRHPILHYEDDAEVVALDYEYMLGSEILIAPVLDEGAVVVDTYLPKGKWVHLWSGEVMGDQAHGGWHTIDAPLGFPAVFYQQGSQAGADLRQHLADKGLIPASWPLP